MQIRGKTGFLKKNGRQAKYEKIKTVRAFELVASCCPSVISSLNNVLLIGTPKRYNHPKAKPLSKIVSF